MIQYSFILGLELFHFLYGIFSWIKLVFNEFTIKYHTSTLRICVIQIVTICNCQTNSIRFYKVWVAWNFVDEQIVEESFIYTSLNPIVLLSDGVIICLSMFLISYFPWSYESDQIQSSPKYNENFFNLILKWTFQIILTILSGLNFCGCTIQEKCQRVNFIAEIINFL